MKLYHFRSGPLNVNTYILVNEDKKTGIVIDSGENYNRIKDTERDLGVKIGAVLLTHAHFDHAGNVKRLQDDGARIYVSEKDAEKLLNEQNLAVNFGRKFEYCTADYKFKDGEVLDLFGIKIEVILTPGHTDGSATFKVDNMLFTGDTLFLECVGRTDFVTGNKDEIVKSVKRLFALNGDYSVYPGHDEFTTLEHERKYNMMADYD